MKTLRALHVYLGCAFAPLLMMFLITGALQTFELHEGRKDNTYKPPQWLVQAASVHTHQRLAPESREFRDPNWPMRIVMVAASLGLLATVSLGVVMAWQLKRERRRALIGLSIGVVLPVMVLFLQRAMR